MASEFDLPNGESPIPSIRIDAAHPGPSRSQPEVAEQVAVESLSAAIAIDAGEPMHLQASQLARHLQERRRQIDQRESQLNARIAELENEARSARLSLRERSDEFDRRENELLEALAERDSQILSLTSAKNATGHLHGKFGEDFEERDALLRHREATVDQSQRLISEESHQLQVARQRLEIQRQQLEIDLAQLGTREAGVAERESRLEESQRHLDEQQTALDDQWRLLHEEHQKTQLQHEADREEIQVERERLKEEGRTLEDQRARHRASMKARQDRLDEQQTVLQRIRNEILQLHREALEMRLIAEQIWAQVSGRLAPHELTQSLSKMRSQLADEFRLAQQDLLEQRSILESLIVRLDEKRRELGSQRDELMGWFQRRQQELAEQTCQIADREQLLASRERACSQMAQDWESERRNLQRQLRQMTVKARQRALAAA